MIMLAAALVMALGTFAVVAERVPMTVTQADGTPLTIVMTGDERCHLTFTTDGYPLFFNALTGNYEYAMADSGTVKGCGIVAADADSRDNDAVRYLQTQDRQAVIDIIIAHKRDITRRQNGTYNRSEARSSAANDTDDTSQTVANRAKLTNFPTVGEQHSLVILVDFADKTFTTVGDDAQTFFDNMLNEEGFTYSNGANGSARDFYVASSAGVFLPVFDVIGPVTLSQSYTYYGENDAYGNDINAGEMVVEACEAAEELVDFSDYDTDGDGYVDNVYFFYAGRGEADGGGNSTIWPHSADLEADFGLSYTSDDGVMIGSYSCSNEARSSSMPAGIGTFVHEFGHTLGLADHYSTTYGAAQYVDPGEWDTMASGNYNNDSNTPPLFSAFERAELGWLSYTELTDDADSIVQLPLLAEYNEALRVSIDGDDDEFFVMENRQLTGWDAYLPGHGMLVWHIDYDEEAWTENVVNTDADHQRVDIVEADSVTGEATYDADPFPGTASVMEYNFYSWEDEYVYGIQGVSETYEDGDTASAVIAFLLADASIELDSPAPLTFQNVTDESFTVCFRKVENAAYYMLNICSVDDNDSLTTVDGYDYAQLMPSELEQNDSLLTINIIDMDPETEYSVSVVAALGMFRSDTVTANVVTDELYFSKRVPQNITISDVTASSFTANWDAVDDADGYIIGLKLQSVSEETTTDGYDFASRSSGMPDLWYCNHTMWISTAGHYGDGAPSLALSSDGDYLLIAYPDTKMSALSFWNIAASEGCGTLCVDIYDGIDGWQTADTIVPDTTGMISELAFELSDTVRLRYNRVNGRVYIDDVYVECHTVSYSSVDTYDGLNVGNVTSYSFSDLEENATFVLTVTAFSGDSVSLTSDETFVYLSDEGAGINAINAFSNSQCLTDDGCVYDLSGRKVNDIGARHGIYIINVNGERRKIIR